MTCGILRVNEAMYTMSSLLTKGTHSLERRKRVQMRKPDSLGLSINTTASASTSSFLAADMSLTCCGEYLDPNRVHVQGPLYPLRSRVGKDLHFLFYRSCLTSFKPHSDPLFSFENNIFSCNYFI